MRPNRGGRLARWVLAAMVWVAGAAAHAQVLDNVGVTQDGTNAVVRIDFAVRIQYLRHVPVDTGDAIRVFFQITASDDNAAGLVEVERRPQPNDLVPRMRVVYPAQAPGVQRRIDILFDKPVSFRLRPVDNHTLELLIPLSDEQRAKLKAAGASSPGAAAASFAAGAIPLPPTPAAPAAPTDVDQRAATDYAAGRAALEAGDHERATLALNRLLNLPPNAYTQTGQELIGIAREKGGETAKAKAEFELYLKLYPDGPGAARVAQRLAALAPAVPGLSAPIPGGGPAPAVAVSPWTYWGSVSQYYYGGQSQATTTTTTVTPATGATTIDTAKITATDQSQLITNVDLTARYRIGNWDSRAVIRDSYNANFLSSGNSQNRLTAAYGESRYLPWQLMGRVGRQSGTSGGVLGLFDGALASWGFRPDYRVNAVAGKPVDPAFNTSKTFYGASVDADNIANRFSGNLFAIRQVVSGNEDRFGVGGEFRYFDAERNVYSLVDYDPTFGALNVGMVQGTWQFPTQTTLNFIADYRRTPTLQLTNALVANPTSSISALVQTLGIDATRELAKSVTPISKMYLVGVTQQLSPKWQLGFDYRLSTLSGTPAVQSLPAMPGTGNVSTYTLQAIGNGLTKYQDILVVNGSALRGAQFDAWLFGLDYRFVVMQNLTLEPLLKYYQQHDKAGLHLSRTTPGIRASWRIRERFSLEAEFDLERTHSTGPLVDDDVTRRFFYLGWRWDL
ncbi:MAG: tetratricopeptide repeat protein [Betaproteobacteria bacterium]